MENIKFLPDEDLVVHKVDFIQLSQTQNWGVDVCKINEAWKVSRGKGIKVAILDTGITPHVDLDGQWNAAYNCTSDPDYTDGLSHGTHVAAIVAATDNDQGVVGIAPECFLIPIKVLCNNGTGSYGFIEAGIRKAIEMGADIINMSLGANVEPPRSVHNAIKDAVNKGIIVIAAAGNDAKAVNWPARFDEVIAVAALDQQGNIAHFSSRDEHVKTVAPGVQIYSAVPVNQYGMMSGTSQASPFVAGVCALLLSYARNTPGAKPINNYVDMLKALDVICDNSKFINTADSVNWGFGIPGFANIDWTKI